MDISWKWLNFFMDDDAELKRIGDAYGAGEMLSGEIKCELIACLTPIIAAHQAARSAVTDARVDQFFSTAPRDFHAMFGDMEGPPPNPPGAGEKVSFQGSEDLVAIGAPGVGDGPVGKGKGEGEGEGEGGGEGGGGGDGEGGMSKNQLKKIQKEKEIAEKKAKKAAEKAAAKAAAAAAP